MKKQKFVGTYNQDVTEEVLGMVEAKYKVRRDTFTVLSNGRKIIKDTMYQVDQNGDWNILLISVRGGLADECVETYRLDEVPMDIKHSLKQQAESDWTRRLERMI